MKDRIFREARKGYLRALFALLFSALAVGFAAAETSTAPSVTAADQVLVDGRVTIARVFSAGPGWLVVHTQTPDGKVGPVIGWSPLRSGENLGVIVAVDAAKATPVLHAMLHVDAGIVGVYEFPGADVPARVGGEMVNPSFKTGAN